MLHELSPTEYHRAWPLFEGLRDHPMPWSVLAGGHPGRVFVDDPTTPTAALVTLWEVWAYLTGDAQNPALNAELNRALFTPGQVLDASGVAVRGLLDRFLHLVSAPGVRE